MALPARAELTTTMKELGDLLTPEEISTFVAIMDKNSDGVVGVSCLINNACVAGWVVLPLREVCFETRSRLFVHLSKRLVTT